MLGLFLLYHFRLFERQMGSAKFAVFVGTTWGLSALITLALFLLIDPKTHTAPGPYPLIFALLVQYYFEVPATYRFHFLGLNGSNKIILYICAINLLASRFGFNPVLLILAASGFVAGLAYRSDVLPLKRLSLPQRLIRFATSYLLPVVQQPRRPPQPINRNVNINGPRGGGAGGGGAPRRTAHAGGAGLLPPPAESEVAALMDLGFSREAAMGALRSANNDTQLAAALLLDPS